ncbi:MAG: tetratricopeptide repeat protein [Chitinophagales bacterium]
MEWQPILHKKPDSLSIVIKTFLFSAVLAYAVFANAQTYDFNANCTDAYNLIQSLRFNEAKVLIEKEKSGNPQNLIPYFLDNGIDFISIYISENETEFKTLAKNKDARLSKIKTGDPASPYYLYCQAEILIQWAFARLKFEEYVTAFSEVRKAFQLLEENDRKFPFFIANKKSLGMLHAIVGAIPDKYKWGVNMLGMEGTIEQGMFELESVIQYANTHTFIFQQESYLYYAFLSLYLQKDDVKAWNIVKDLNTKNNLLNTFCIASIGMRTGRNNEAIAALQNKPTGSQYYPFPFLDFLHGLALLRKLDPAADAYFHKFLQTFKGKNYIKEAYQKLAWSALLQNNKAKYTEYMQLCITKGDDIIDDDKQALMEAQRNKPPHVVLLKSRLLFDGGYYKEALKVLEGLNTDDFPDPKDKAEFTYRAARIYHASGNPEKAKGYYNSTIKNGESLPYYFAAGSALKLGEIFEKEGNYIKAKEYYNRCLNMKNEEYKTGLDSQAKAGLNRLKSK